jgi:hypothetical protein
MPEVVARKAVLSDDGTHEHVLLVGYASPHLGAGEPITIDVERLVQKQAIGERFTVATADGEAEVVAGACPVCGLEPYLRTTADTGVRQLLLELPPAG